HQGVNGEFAFAELGANIENFLLRVVPLPALPISVSPLRKQWRFAGQLPIIGNDTVQLRSVEEVIINSLPHFRAERGGVPRRTGRQLDTSGTALGRDLVLFARL